MINILFLFQDCSLFVTVYSSVQSTPMSTLHQIEHVGGQKIQTKPLGILMPSARKSYEYFKSYEYNNTSHYEYISVSCEYIHINHMNTLMQVSRIH